MKSQLIENRHIRVFISSTFRDMQDERDYLMRYAFPRIREIAAARDVAVTELDLRWGITQEESQSGAVVDICLKEIENSIPFFIGIIGNRYGWIPSESDVRRGTIERFSQVKNYLEDRLSVTEMEMQFGVLQREEDMHAYFYIKDYNDEHLHPEWGLEPEDSKMRLAKLIKDVNNSRYPSSPYSSSEDLCEQVEKAFVSLLDQLFPLSVSSNHEKEQIVQRSLKNRLCQSYVIPEEHFHALDAWLTNTDSKVLVVEGDCGIGKSSLLANWLKEKESQPSGCHIVSHFIGNGGSYATKEYLSECIARDICLSYGWDLTISLTDTLSRVTSSSEPLLIVIDAINQLLDVDDAKLLNWLPVPSNNVKVMFTTIPGDRTSEVFLWRGYERYSVPAYSTQMRRDLTASYLRMYAKSLSDEQLERIISHPLCGNTFILKTVLDELINFGYFERMDEKIDSLISRNHADEFFFDYLETYEQIYEFQGKCFIPLALSLIALSKYGLSEDEILSLTQVRQLQWSQFYCSFKSNFIIKNGLISFSHEHIRSAVVKRYLNTNSEWERQCRNILIEFFEAQNTVRTWDELPNQLFILKRHDRLCSVLSDERCFFRLLKREPLSLWSYWNSLIVSGSYSPDIYLSTINADFDKDCLIALFISKYFRDPGCALKFMLRARKHLVDDKNVDYLVNMGDVLVDSYPGDANSYYRKAAYLLLNNASCDTCKIDLAYCALQIAVSNDWEGWSMEIPVEELESRMCANPKIQVHYSEFAKDMEDSLKEFLASGDFPKEILSKYKWTKDAMLQKLVSAGLLVEEISELEPNDTDYVETDECEIYDELAELKKCDSIFQEYKFDFENRLYGEDRQKAFFEEAVRMYRKSGLSEDSPQIGECYMKLHEILRFGNKPEDTIIYLDKAYNIYSRMKTPRCSEVIKILRSKAKVYTNILFECGETSTTTNRGYELSVSVIENIYSEILDSVKYMYGTNSVDHVKVLEEYADFYDSREDFVKENDCYVAIRDIYHNLKMDEEERDAQHWIDTYLRRRIKN